MKSLSINWISCGQPFTEPAIWKPNFCIVTDCQLLLLDKQEECRVELCTVWLLHHTLTVPTDSHTPGDHTAPATDGSEYNPTNSYPTRL
ncbi:unnamed protein product, partial [Coregonus sp. 'balchen']